MNGKIKNNRLIIIIVALLLAIAALSVGIYSIHTKNSRDGNLNNNELPEDVIAAPDDSTGNEGSSPSASEETLNIKDSPLEESGNTGSDTSSKKKNNNKESEESKTEVTDDSGQDDEEYVLPPDEL